MQIGCQINTWGKLDVPSILKEVAATGYEGFEAALPKIADYLDKPDEFKAMVEENGLALASIYVPGKWQIRAERENDLANCRKAAELASAMGCQYLILGGGTMKPEDNLRDVLDETAVRYNECAKIAGEHGLLISIHPHAHENATVASPMQIAEIMDSTFPTQVFLCPDVGGHVVKGGGDAVEVVRIYAPRIKYIHFKDIDASGNWCLLGEGTTDYPVIIRHLRSSGFDGWIVAEEECRPKIEELGPTECARRNRKFLRGLAK